MTWIAAAAVVIVLGLLNGDSLYLHLFGAVIGLTQVVALLRFGVFSTMVASAVVVQLSTNLVTADFSAWYAGSEIASLAIVLALALWAFRTALGGRKVWKGDLLEN